MENHYRFDLEWSCMPGWWIWDHQWQHNYADLGDVVILYAMLVGVGMSYTSLVEVGTP